MTRYNKITFKISFHTFNIQCELFIMANNALLNIKWIGMVTNFIQFIWFV